MLKIGLVGLPNVGKSTLFNRLTRTRDALVSDTPGLTRDHRIGTAQLNERRWLVYDTGGMDATGDELTTLIVERTKLAVGDSDIIVFVVDAQAGLTPIERELATQWRETNKPVWLVINKAEGLEAHEAIAEFAPLGVARVFVVSALRRQGLDALSEAMAEASETARDAHADDFALQGMRVTFVGRPNAGKSTLVNQLLGETRMLVSDTPGTTRDSIAVPFHRGDESFILGDTAGVRRKRGTKRGAEVLSILKTFENMALSDVAVLVCDASEGVTDQDAKLAAHALDAGCGLIVAFNKSDLLTTEAARLHLERTADLSLQFIDDVPRQMICARTGDGVDAMLEQVSRCYALMRISVGTSRCTRILNEAQQASPPPLVAGRRPRLRYANQAGDKPPRFILHGHRVDALPQPYRRYLANYFRKALGLFGVRVVLEFRATPNPYVGGEKAKRAKSARSARSAKPIRRTRRAQRTRRD